jgi:hypothetical protein
MEVAHGKAHRWRKEEVSGTVANMPPSVNRPRNSIAFAQARDTRITWLLDRHPVTAAMLVALGLFASKRRALRRLDRLVNRGRIRLVGTVRRNAGRPEHVFCRWRPKVDDLVHEIELTALCLRLNAERIDRGPHVTDQTLRPDAEIWINGQVYYLELDRGTMGYHQMERRFQLYGSFPHFVIWVCPTAERRDGLRARADCLRPCALFTTFAEAVEDPHRPIWLDYAASRVALPAQGSTGKNSVA